MNLNYLFMKPCKYISSLFLLGGTLSVQAAVDLNVKANDTVSFEQIDILDKIEKPEQKKETIEEKIQHLAETQHHKPIEVVKKVSINEAIDKNNKEAKKEIVSPSEEAEFNALKEKIQNNKPLLQSEILRLQALANQNKYNAALLLGKYYLKNTQETYRKNLAIQWFLLAADNGNGEAMYALYQFYLKDYTKAAYQHLKRSAKAGYLIAQRILGEYYIEGNEFIGKNPKKAFEWTEKAAQQADAIAQTTLGDMYFDGFYVEKNFGQAVKFYQAAALQNYSTAYYRLSYMYYHGLAAPCDYKKVIDFAQKAVDGGNKEASIFLGNIYYYGLSTEKDYKKAFDYYTEAAAIQFFDAEYMLGIMYLKGQYVKQDYIKARIHFENAANKNHLASMVALGTMHYEGLGVEKNFEEAFHFFEKAESQGSLEAKNHLAFMYQNGQFVKKDEEKAFDYYKELAKKSFVQAQYNVALAYYQGMGTRQSYKKAYKWFANAAEQEDAKSLYMMAYMHCTNQYVSLDLNLAKSLLKRSAEAGYEPAKNLSNYVQTLLAVSEKTAEYRIALEDPVFQKSTSN